MGLFSSLARTGARATGRALATHVVPDSLIPSWKTQKAASTGYNLLKKAARRNPPKPASNRPASAGGDKRKAAPAARPAPKAPAKKFDKQSWAIGRALPSGDGFAERPPSPSASRSVSSRKPLAPKLRQQLSDLRHEPRLVAQMGLDLLAQEYQQKKATFLSSLRRK